MLVKAKQAGCQVETISVKFPPRQHGHSNWASTWKSKLRTIWRSVKYMTRLAVAGDGGKAEGGEGMAETASPASNTHGVKRPHLLNVSTTRPANTKR